MFDTIKKKYGGVDVCINNAGMSHNKSLLGNLFYQICFKVMKATGFNMGSFLVALLFA